MTNPLVNSIHVIVTFDQNFEADGYHAFAKVITGFDGSRPGGFSLDGRFVAGKRVYAGNGAVSTQFQAHVPERDAAFCVCIQARDSKQRVCIVFRPQDGSRGGGTFHPKNANTRWENAYHLRVVEDSGDASPFNALYAAGEWLTAAGLIPSRLLTSPLPPMSEEAIRAQLAGAGQPYSLTMTVPTPADPATLVGPVAPAGPPVIPARQGNLVDLDTSDLPQLPHPYYWANLVSGVFFVGRYGKGEDEQAAPMLFLDCLIDVIDRIDPGELPALEKVLREQQARLGGLGMALDVVANVLALKNTAQKG